MIPLWNICFTTPIITQVQKSESPWEMTKLELNFLVLNMHIYKLCLKYIQNFTKFHAAVKEELCQQKNRTDRPVKNNEAARGVTSLYQWWTKFDHRVMGKIVVPYRSSTTKENTGKYH